jgi:hypothetical protein
MGAGMWMNESKKMEVLEDIHVLAIMQAIKMETGAF